MIAMFRCPPRCVAYVASAVRHDNRTSARNSSACGLMNNTVTNVKSCLVQIFVGMPPINAFNVARQALHIARALTHSPDRDVAIEETIGGVPTPNRSPPTKLFCVVVDAFICSNIMENNTTQYSNTYAYSSALPKQYRNVADFTRSMKTCKQRATKEPIQFRVHFQGTKELYERLRQLGYSYEKKAYVDLFFDTKNYDLVRNCLWFKKRYQYDYETHGQHKPDPISSLKRVDREGDDISITYTQVPNPLDTIKQYEQKLRPLVSISFIRHSFKTDFGYLWIEEVAFAPQESSIIATAVVNDEKLFANFCQRHEEIRKALELAPAASKVVERIRKLRSQRPKELEPLWNAMLEIGTITRPDWTSEVCQFNPAVTGYPISHNDEFWTKKEDSTVDMDD